MAVATAATVFTLLAPFATLSMIRAISLAYRILTPRSTPPTLPLTP
jgi:hypothetical protein